MTDIDHEELQSLLGAYALDATDAEEAEVIDLHLRECPRCRTEVQEHRETASFLAHSGQPAPEGGWDRLVATLDERPPKLDLSLLKIPAGARVGDATIVAPARWRRMVAVTAVAAALLAVLAGVTVIRFNDRVDGLKRDVTLASGIRDEALRAATDPARREVRLVSNQGKAGADAVLLPDGRLYIIHDTLAEVSPDRTYQVWGVFADKRIVSLGLLGNDPDVAMLRADPSIASVAITVEQSGGVVASTNPPTVAGPVPA